MKVVFLDRFAIRSALRPLRFAHQWQEYSTTTPKQVVERLAGAQIAITNRVRFDQAVISQLPDLQREYAVTISSGMKLDDRRSPTGWGTGMFAPTL